MKKGGLAGIAKGELVVLLRPSRAERDRRPETGRVTEVGSDPREATALARHRRQRLRSGRRARPPRSLPLRQSRAVLAGLQRPGAPARRGRVAAADRAAEVPGDLRHQPRRVLHDPRRRRPRPGRRPDRRPRSRRPDPDRGAGRDPRAGPRAGSPSRRAVLARWCGRSWPSTASGSSAARSPARPHEAIERHFREQIFPVLTPLGVGAGPAVPLHLQPVAEPDRPSARPRRRPGGVRPGQGAQGGPAPVRRDREGHVHPARGHHRPSPRRAVPGDGDPQPRPLPRHPRRRLRGLRRGRRPAPGGRGRAAPPALRRGRAARGRRGHGARACARA